MKKTLLILLSAIFFAENLLASLEGQLVRATRRNNPHKVQELLDQGANPNAIPPVGKTPLQIASAHGYVEIARMLINHPRTDVNLTVGPIKQTPLHLAAKYGHEKIVGFLIAKGANINAKNVFGKTAADLAKTQTIKQSILREQAKK